MNKIRFFFAIILVLLSFSLALPDQSDYRLGDGDVLRIMVYDSPDLNTTARLSGGSIMFPLLGQVNIHGLTVSQVAEKLSGLLAQGYLVNPQVSVFVDEFRSKKVTIMGQVKGPGLYELTGPTSLMELISKAGGLTEDAGGNVTIKRKFSQAIAGEEIKNINLKKLFESGDRQMDILILDGDNVFVPKAGVFYVTGEVKRPDAYKIEEGATVIKAITMAGGFTGLAAKKKIRILRQINGVEHVLKNVSLRTPILPEDVIVVPESFF